MSRFDKWTQVRLTNEVHAMLRAFAERTERLAAENPERYPAFVCVEGLSLSAAIKLLLFRHDQHTARGKRQSRKPGLRIAPGT